MPRTCLVAILLCGPACGVDGLWPPPLRLVDGQSSAPRATADAGPAPPFDRGSSQQSPDPKRQEPDEPSPGLGPAPTPDSCDPGFLGPFCSKDSNGRTRITGFVMQEPADPTLQQVREYSAAAVNYIRAMTCLAPLQMDDCLDRIATEALEAGSGHGYFIQNCLNGSTGYGRQCECNWTQENIGAASGTGRNWADGIHVPLCGMMTEPKGQGHRSNIESPLWKRIGVGIRWSRSGASWFHEFGCDANATSCPKS